VIEGGGHDAGAPGVGEHLGAVADQGAGGDHKLDAGAAVAGGVHGPQLAHLLAHFFDDDAGVGAVAEDDHALKGLA
jgi:hypothetical protein